MLLELSCTSVVCLCDNWQQLMSGRGNSVGAGSEFMQFLRMAYTRLLVFSWPRDGNGDFFILVYY